MNNYQETTDVKRGGAEFFKIYALTIVMAFLLMAVVQYRLGDEPAAFFKKEQAPPEVPASQIVPMADANDLFPVWKLKNLIVNLSF